MLRFLGLSRKPKDQPFNSLQEHASGSLETKTPEHKHQTIEQQVLHAIATYKAKKKRVSIEMQYLIEFAQLHDIKHKPLDAKALIRLTNLLNTLRNLVKDKKSSREALKPLFDNPFILLQNLDKNFFTRPNFKALMKKREVATKLTQAFQKLHRQESSYLQSQFTKNLLYKFPEHADVLADQIIAIQSSEYIQAFCAEMFKLDSARTAAKVGKEYKEMYEASKKQAILAISTPFATKAAQYVAQHRKPVKETFSMKPKHSSAFLRYAQGGEEKTKATDTDEVRLVLQ